MSSVSRRRFIQTAAVGAAGSLMLGQRRQQPGIAEVSARSADSLQGVLLATSKFDTSSRLDLISLQENRLLATFERIEASHAVVPVEALNRFFVHGRETRTDKGFLWGLEVEPATGAWSVIYERELAGGNILHWQPNRDYSLIQYNTTGDGTLHVLDTNTLELQTYTGGGSHSNMAFFNDDRWLVATDRLGERTLLRVIDRASNSVLSETNVGDWGHGVTVNDRTGQGFVWAGDGVHVVSLARQTLGEHLGVIATEAGQRSWFCWTPQGGRYSHDQTWNPSDRYSPWLTVLDTQNQRLERIATGEERPGTLQISPDGRWGACGSLSSNKICLFDIEANTWLGTVAAGRGSTEFFDRDLAFSRDRRWVFASNPPERSVTVIDRQEMQAIGQIDLPVEPQWVKVLTA